MRALMWCSAVLLELCSNAQQPFELSDQHTSAVMYLCAASMSDGEAMAGTAVDTVDSKYYGLLIRRDLLGGILFQDTLHYGDGVVQPLELLSSMNDELTVVSQVMPCPGSALSCGVRRYDAQGLETYNTTFPGSQIWEADVSPSGYTAVATAASVTILDNSGAIVSQWTEPSSPITALGWETDSTLLLVATAQLRRRTISGILMDSTALPVYPNISDLLVVDHSTRLLLGGSYYLVVDSGLAIQDSVYFGTISVNAREWMHDEEMIWIRTHDHFIQLTTLYALGQSFPVDDLSGLVISEGLVNENRIITVGRIYCGGTMSGHVRTYLLDGTTTVRDVDIRVEVSAVDSVWYELEDPVPMAAIFHGNVIVSLINEGSEPLAGGVLVSVSASPTCGLETRQLEFYLTGLSQGDTAFFPMTDISHRAFRNYVELPLATHLCVTLMSPNGVADRDRTNNIACVDLTYPDMVDVSERVGVPAFHFGPNPADESITFQVHHLPGMSIRLFDASGRCLRQLEALRETRTTMDVSGIGPGLYTAMVQIDGQFQAVPIVIAH